MGRDVFYVLGKNYRYLSNYMSQARYSLFKKPQAAIRKEKTFIENLTLEIAKIEGKYSRELVKMTHEERVKNLEEENIITSDIYKYFNELRLIENQASDLSIEEGLEAALRIYKSIYIITTWFVQKYVDSEYEAEEYKSPVPLEGRTYDIDNDTIFKVIKKVDESEVYEKLKLKEEKKIQEKLEKTKIKEIDDDFMNMALESIFEND